VIIDVKQVQLDRLSSVSGAKIMAQTPNFCWKITSHKRYTWTFWPNAITRQPIELESCSNHQKTRKIF